MPAPWGTKAYRIIGVSEPPLVAALAYIWLHETPTKMDFLGSGITFEGVCLAVFFGHKEVSKSDATVGHMSTNIILGITATGCQGFEFLVMKPAMIAGTDPLAGSAIHLLGRAFLNFPYRTLARQNIPATVQISAAITGSNDCAWIYWLRYLIITAAFCFNAFRCWHCHRSGASVFCAGLTNSVGKRRSGATCTSNPRSRFSNGWHHHNYNFLR